MTGGVAANHGNSVPSGQHEAWVACRALLPHARKVLGYALGLAEEMVDRATIANNMAWYLLMGEHAAAEEVGCCAMMAREKVLRPEHSDTLISVSNLGSVLERQRKYEEAEAMHRRSLKGREKVLGPEHPYTLISVSNLRSVLLRQGKYEEAEELGVKAMETREDACGVRATSLSC